MPPPIAQLTRTLRRGLPRVRGGEPWPSAAEAGVGGAAPVEVAAEAPAFGPIVVAPARTADPSGNSGGRVSADGAGPETRGVGEAPTVGSTAADTTAAGVRLRRGLPRRTGGEPWPPASLVTKLEASPSVAERPAAHAEPPPASPPETAEAGAPLPAPVEKPGASAATVVAGVLLRRGLPRVRGGEPWPPAVEVPVTAPPVPQAEAEAPPSTAVERARRDVSTPLPFPPTVFAGAHAFTRPPERPEPRRLGPFTLVQWVGAAVVAGGGLLVAAAMTVFAVRWLVSLEVMREFFAAFPGEYELPEQAPVGFPAWLAWQHFFNVFLIALIIRSGWRIHHEKRPAAFWSPRGNPKRRVSLTVWFHQFLDVFWVTNGVIYVVLLFATGQWVRLVPTSWEVFPNAVSAGLQYVSLNWPTDNGWVNYNSLQQLAYFATVFIAAPLAVVTGVRMSGLWPERAAALNRLYPIEWARAVHYPVMLYFVVFIAGHVGLVFATGALRNLNHMYGGQDAVNWTGFWVFVASMVVIAAAWVAARPVTLAPIARLFGTVKSR